MNWLSDITPPGIKKMFRQRDEHGDALWSKCPACEEMIFSKDLEASQHVCPNCDHHMRISPTERLTELFDNGAFTRLDLPAVVDDPLKFKDTKKYHDRLRDSRKKTGEQDALVAAQGRIEGKDVVIVIQNFDFMGGSMGMALGEGIVMAAETAIAASAPLVIFTSSGGARMQEGILSLMQMPRTTIAVQMLRDAGLPYIVVLTHPTTGGVTASYAMLGDVHLAEPGALIGFAGPRVIEQTIREKLPDGFQRAEYLLDKGMVDAVVHRHALRETLASLLIVFMKAGAVADDRRGDVPALTHDKDGEAEPAAEELPKAAE
jgi:acetyl-CoA carboxylase carboxyl transferase subunit beta